MRVSGFGFLSLAFGLRHASNLGARVTGCGFPNAQPSEGVRVSSVGYSSLGFPGFALRVLGLRGCTCTDAWGLGGTALTGSASPRAVLDTPVLCWTHFMVGWTHPVPNWTHRWHPYVLCRQHLMVCWPPCVLYKTHGAGCRVWGGGWRVEG